MARNDDQGKASGPQSNQATGKAKTTRAAAKPRPYLVALRSFTNDAGQPDTEVAGAGRDAYEMLDYATKGYKIVKIDPPARQPRKTPAA